MGIIGKLFFSFLAVVAVLAIVGCIISRRRVARGEATPADQQEEALPDKVVENVFDWKDRFNRARYMDKDGE